LYRQSGHTLEKKSPKCAFLNQYGVMPKYPNDLQINDDDVKSAIKFAKDIKEFVLLKLKK
jgi:phage FluMu protein Com